MSNTFFQFKQFTVKQEITAMKVSTDGCLFGAVIETGNAETILDIGTGTGLLSLMLAQRSFANIDAVDIDESAYKQARDNFNHSLWKERLHAHHSDITDWYHGGDKKFDLIVCNPPFFTDHLKSSEEGKNFAKHAVTLSLNNLLNAVLKFLNVEGVFYLMLPPTEMERFITVSAKKDLHLNKKIIVKNFNTGPVFRIIASFSFTPTPLAADEIIIWEAKEKYSERFIELLKEYYLYL